MIKIREQFSLEEYKKGTYEVRTENGDKVTIFRVDGKGDYPIQGSIERDNESISTQWNDIGFSRGYINNRTLYLHRDEYEVGDVVVFCENEKDKTSFYIGILKSIRGDEQLYYDVCEYEPTPRERGKIQWKGKILRLANNAERKCLSKIVETRLNEEDLEDGKK